MNGKVSSRLGYMDEEMETEASKLILDDVEDFGVGRSYWTLLILDADDI